MSDASLPTESKDDLQFTTAEAASLGSAKPATAQTCALCSQPITESYYAVGDKMLCPLCSTRVAAPITGSKIWRFLRASLFGLGAGSIGALIWFVIRRVTGLEIGFVALLVGFLVGQAVRKGSKDRGGVVYQVLAVLLTYGCITINYMPDVLEGITKAAKERGAAQANANGAAQPDEIKLWTPEIGTGKAIARLAVILALVFWFSLQLPFFGGAENLMGMLIIGIALWEAWKFNSRRPVPISGPYQVGPRPVT